MTAISSTAVLAPTSFAGAGRAIARCQDGTLVTVIVNSANGLEIWYSKDNGATWAKDQTLASAGYSTNNHSMFVDLDDNIHLVFKQQATAGGRTLNQIYYLRGTPNAGRTAWTFGGQLDVGVGNYPDLVAHRDVSGGGWTAHVVYSDATSVRYYRVAITAAGATSLTVSGTQPLTSTAAPNGPSIDFQHTGDGKTVQSGTPTVWIGASVDVNKISLNRYVYSAGAWTLGTAVVLSTTLTYDYASTALWGQLFWDGTRCCLAGVFVNGTANDLVVLERDAANTTTTVRTLAAAVSTTFGMGSATYDNSGNLYLVAMNSTNLVYRKWTRASSTLSAATTIAALTGGSYYPTLRRGQANFGRLDMLYGSGSPYAANYDKIVNSTAPTAPTGLSPTGGVTLDRTIAQQFSWTFADPDLYDTQASAILQYRLVGAGTWTQIAVGVAPNYTFSGSALAAGDYEWQVQTTDNNGSVSPFSASSFFTMATPPATPTITAPTSGGTVNNTQLTTWTAAAQDAYQVRTVADSAGTPDTATVYTDSGTVIDTPGRSRTTTFAVNGRHEHIQVRVRSGGLWSLWASIRVLVSFVAPATPTLTVTPDSSGNITVRVINPAPSGGQPVVVSWDVYRKVGASGTGFRIAKDLTGDWTDRSPANGVDYRYLVRALGSTGTTGDSAWST
jgi:hypothetical protein